MDEADPFPVELEHTRSERLVERGLRARHHRLDDVGGRLGHRRHDVRRLECRRREPIQPLLQKRVQARRQRQLRTRLDPAAAADKRARQLQREEGVAAGGLVDAEQDRSRERCVEPRAEQFVDGADGQSFQLDLERLQGP
jgi:hypothetical protein